MYGYPRRKITTRRLAPNVPLFDPSGDARCTGWWRADRNVAHSATALVTGWTSQLSNGNTLALIGPYPGVYVPDLTNGFPAVMTSNGTSYYQASNLAQDGDRECTITYVARAPHWDAGSQSLLWDGLNLTVGWWGNGLCLWSDGNGNNTGIVWAGRTPAVITARGSPRSDVDLNRRCRLQLNGAPVIDWNSGNNKTALATSVLTIGYQPNEATFWHEVIFFRQALSDDEVATMHTLLMRQYGIGA